MESSTSLLLASLLFCLLTLQLSQAYWIDIEGVNDQPGGILKEWREAMQDDIEVIQAFTFYTETLKMADTPPGRYYCTGGDQFLIMSDNHPGDYPPRSKKKWIFKPDSDTYIKIKCPKIRILPSRRCKKDKLVIFTGKKFRRGVRRCGRINNYSWYTYDNLKVTFKSNGDSGTSKGFICTVSCTGKPTTTSTPPSTSTTSSTTTTFSPTCPDPAFPPPVPTPVSTCSDLAPEYTSICDCTECNGNISLTCSFCTRCDFDIFALYHFNVDVILQPNFTCPEPMDVSGYFFHNADDIKALRICVNEYMSHITFPFAELVNLETLAYQDCTNDLIDICSDTRRRKRSVALRDNKALIASTRTTYSVTLPDAAEIPNVVKLYLHDVNMVLSSSTLPYPDLQLLDVDSDDVDVDANAFSNFVAIQHLYVKICKTGLVSDSFRFDATSLESLDIYDTCVHTFADDSIVLEGVNSRTNGSCLEDSTISVAFTASSTFFDHIPICPFRALLELDCVSLVWDTEVQCRSCGGIWYWDLMASVASNITSTCYDTVSTTSMNLADYIDDNSKPCPFTLNYSGCS